jgi:hypothetical protein
MRLLHCSENRQHAMALAARGPHCAGKNILRGWALVGDSVAPGGSLAIFARSQVLHRALAGEAADRAGPKDVARARRRRFSLV